MEFSKCSLRECIGVLRMAAATSIVRIPTQLSRMRQVCLTLHHAMVFRHNLRYSPRRGKIHGLARKASRFGKAA